MHRFIITAITVSSKALCDVFCTASHYAKVGGLSLNELNLLEREFLRILDWNLTCDNKQLEEYYLNLVNSHPSYTVDLDIEEAVAEEKVSSADVDTISVHTYAYTPPPPQTQLVPQSRPSQHPDTHSPQQRRRLS